MIPKKIGFYWSKNKLSFLRYLTLYSFRKYNPDWAVTLYLDKAEPKKSEWLTPEQQDLTQYKGADYLEKVKDLVTVEEWESPIAMNPAHACDYCQWETLATRGGFFADMDILFLKSLNNFYEELCGNESLVCKVGYNLAIGFLGSSKGSDLYTTVYDEAKNFLFPPIGYQMMGTDLLKYIWQNSPRITTKTRRGFEKEEIGLLEFYLTKFVGVSEINKLYFYPWEWSQMNLVFEESLSRLPAITLGLHWYGGTSVAQKYNNLITEKTLTTSTICNLVKKVLND